LSTQYPTRCPKCNADLNIQQGIVATHTLNGTIQESKFSMMLKSGHLGPVASRIANTVKMEGGELRISCRDCAEVIAALETAPGGPQQGVSQ